MRALISTMLLVAGLAVATAGAGADPREGAADEAEVLAVIHGMFDAMRAKDTVALAAAFHPDARLHTTSVREGVPVVRESPIADFVRSVGSATVELDERLGGEEVKVDAGLASAWTPYAFHADGEFSHCGVNAFQLVRTEDGWKILQITDTRRRDACPPGSPR